jgi:hypothetical protein
MSTQKETFSINDAYGQNNPVTPITSSEIDQMRKRLFDNISDLNANKHRLSPDEYHQLLNYHHYAMTILDNRKIINQAEMCDPYNRNMKNVVGDHRITNIETINPYESKMKVIYKKNGQAQLVDQSGIKNNKFKGEWEQQFDEGVINPPCFTFPPSNLWGLPLKQ